MLYFIWLYFSRRTTQLGYAGTTMNLQIILNTQKNPYLNQATGKKYLPNFPTPQKSQNRKFQTPKNPSIIPVPPWAFHEQFITGTVSGNLSKFKQWEPSPNPGFLSQTHFKTALFKHLLYFSDHHRNGECCRLPIDG